MSQFFAFILLMVATASYAADDVDDFFSMTPSELAAISVSIATGTPQPKFQSAGSTSVVTAEQIQAMGATELHEIMETVPGVHVSLQPITNDYRYIVRGISNATNSQMLILLNGTRITSPFQGSTASSLDLPTAAIQRVEVIRGPGSAVYGADAFAGVINVITKKASDIGGTQLGVRAGNWDSQSGWGQNGSHWAGWDIASSIQYQHTQGDPGRIIPMDTQTQLDRAFNTQASLAPGPVNSRYQSIDTHINLQRKNWDINLWAFNALDIGTRIGGAGALDSRGGADGDQYLGDIRFSTEDWFDKWEFLAHLSYLHSDVHANVNLFPDNSVLPITPSGEIASNFNTKFKPVLFPNGVIEDIRHVQKIPAIEFSTIYKGLDRHLLRFSAGFRYEEISIHNLSNSGAGAINGANPPPVIGSQLTDKTGTQYAFLKDTSRAIGSLVLQDEWQIANDWHLTAGLRYDQYSDFGSTFNPRFALAWNINEQLTSKFLYGKAFRAPSFTELGTQNNPVLLGNVRLKPEIINTLEWAFDYRPFSSLRTGLNLYYYHINDLITVTKTDWNAAISQYQNAGNQDGYGTEFEWNWKVSQRWSIAGNYAWQNARTGKAANRVSGIPEHRIYFAGLWQFMPNWQFQSQFNWVAGRVLAVNDTRALDDYETVDFTLNAKKLWGHINLAASLRNAFNNRGFEEARPELPTNTPLSGRNFYFQASVDF